MSDSTNDNIKGVFGYRNVQLYLFAKNGFTKGGVERAAELGNVVLVTYHDIICDG